MYSDGETDAYGSHIWQCDIAEKEVPTFRQLCDIPGEVGEQKYLFCHHGNGTDYIYMLGPEYACHRLNLGTSVWEDMPNLPLPAEEVEASFNGLNTVTLATNDGQLLCYDQSGDVITEWEVKVDMGFPNGISSMLNDTIYTYNVDENELYRCDFLTGDINKVDDHDLDSKMMSNTVAVTSSSSGLLFTGYHYSKDTLSLLELMMGAEKKGVVAGYLENTSSSHQIFVCELP